MFVQCLRKLNGFRLMLLTLLQMSFCKTLTLILMSMTSYLTQLSLRLFEMTLSFAFKWVIASKYFKVSSKAVKVSFR